ncbi:hypothetical protein [Ottowia sp.]|uniref:hypothetical protein n=1 Tax=Ottowia sp. TaxID=1898956 RepID=UPI002C589E95|nr:hypothetical protein [Ottowia sp.]HRN76918.1 hypothetical protein [Ottowia sp.]HRQ03688.1 hypothetical protein [Ottowia sp.]
MVQQEAVWLITLVLMSLILMVFMFVYARSQQRVEDYTPLKDRAYSLRTKFFWLLVVTLIPTGLYLLTDQPYAKAGDEAKADQVVDVVGYQWRWELSQSEFNAGETVLFRITSADVNHGFGIYDQNLRLVAQMQSMPGYTNLLRYTFDKPGTYKALCMEYCGTAHHGMISDIQVR